MTFRPFFEKYLESWRNSELHNFIGFLSEDYKAREVTDGEIEDFGYRESVSGWEQGFRYAIEKEAEWQLNELSVIPLREDEVMAIISATMVINGEKMENGNLFFQTFKKVTDQDWKLVRSYIEAGVSLSKVTLIKMPYSN